MTKWLLGLALAATAEVGAAGVHIGNGGDVVKCPNGPKVYELLDFVEARILRQIPVDLGAPELPVEAKVELALDRLERVEPQRARRYRTWAATFDADTFMPSGVVLTDVPDSAHRALPEGCIIEQIAIHKEPVAREDRRYLVSKNLWEKLDNDSRAGLILHELIYREADEFSIESSDGVRYLNSLLFSGRIDGYTVPEYLDVLMRIGFKSGEVNGLELDLVSEGPPSWHENGALARGKLVRKERFESEWGELELTCQIAFFPDGSLQGFNLAVGEEVTFDVGGRQVTFEAYRGPDSRCWKPGDRVAPYDVYFVDVGVLQFGVVARDYPIHMVSASYDVRLSGPVDFGERGEPLSGLTVDGREGWVRIGSETGPCYTDDGAIGFDVLGRLRHVTMRQCVQKLNGTLLSLSGLTEVHAHDDGTSHVYASYVAQGPYRKLVIRGKERELRSSASPTDKRAVIAFFETGAVRIATFANDEEFEFADGHVETVPAGGQAWFNEYGQVEYYVWE